MRLVRPAVPDAVTAIARRLESTGRPAWLTGECLADLLRDRERRRFTLATAAPASEIAGLFERAVPTAPHEAVWQLPTPAGPVDIVPAAPGLGLTEILRERALTAWAMAWSPIHRALTDPHAGHADLGAGRLRMIGDAPSRLAAQPALALAVARLCAQHGDAPDEDLERALADVGAADLERVPAVFRGRAVQAIVESPRAGEAVALLVRTGLDRALGLKTRDDTPRLLDSAPPILELRLALWLRGNRPGRFLRRHRIHPERSERVIALLGTHPVEQHYSPRRRSSLLRLAGLAPTDRDALFWLRTQELAESADTSQTAAARRDLEALRSALADHLEREAERRAAPELALNGREIMEILGVGPSPLVGRALAHLRERVTATPALNEPDALRTLLARWSQDRPEKDGQDGGRGRA